MLFSSFYFFLFSKFLLMNICYFYNGKKPYILKKKNEMKFSIVISSGSYHLNQKSWLNKEKICTYWNNIFVCIIMQHLGIPDLKSTDNILQERKPLSLPINTHSFQMRNDWRRLMGRVLWKNLGDLSQVYQSSGKYKVEFVTQKADGQEQFEIQRRRENIPPERGTTAPEHLSSDCSNAQV